MTDPPVAADGPASRRPPAVLNAILTICVPLAMAAALVAAGRAPMTGYVWPLATLAFGLLFLCNYSIMHEAAHGKLQRNRRLNALSGAWASIWFPMPYTLLERSHICHHRGNRTDEELFDAFGPGENPFSKRLRWYGMLFGMHYLVLAASNVLVLLMPRSLILETFGRDATYARFAQQAFTPAAIRKMRIEACVNLLVFSAILSNIDALAALPAVYFGVFLWSTNQYLPHAFTNRDPTHGAFNLTGAGPVGWLLLNRQYDLNHHRNPGLPWIYLSETAGGPGETKNYFLQWLHLWRGPRPVSELPGVPAAATTADTAVSRRASPSS